MSTSAYIGPGPQEAAWNRGEAEAVAAMGMVNLGTARLVSAIQMLIETAGWVGHGIMSIEHWVTWKAGVSRDRAARLTRIARRIEDLPQCWALFEQGRLTEDAMVVIARRVPACRDAEVAGWAPGMLISQLRRALASCPELPDGDDKPKREPEERRFLRLHRNADGSGSGEFALPPDEMAVFEAALQAGRDAEYRDREDLESDAEVPAHHHVSLVDGLVRVNETALAGLDPVHERTGRPGERNKLVVHCDLNPDGTLGPGQIHLGAVIPDTLRRYLSCDTEVQLATYRAGRLLGIHPTRRTVDRNLRRVIERRDQGCVHPLCGRSRWLHIHHIHHWEHGGLTTPENLVTLCTRHHRDLHQGHFRMEGSPEAGDLRFCDSRGHPIEPPPPGPEVRPPEGPSPFNPPFGERLDPDNFRWN